jgi:diguanylate cyclase (GGDEF)-like protein/PAS domain S-box-containing protein
VSTPATVLVLTPSIGGFYFGELLTGIGREITAAGGRVVLVQTDAGEDGSADALASPVAWAHIDGAVAITSAVPAAYLQRLRDADKPVVLVSARMDGFAAPTAVPDNHGGTVAAVEHLIGHGHTRIGFVGNLAQPDVLDRYQAYLDALEANGLPVDPALLFRASDNEWDGGSAAAADVLASADPPTALMIATDRNAIGLMRTLTAAGWDIPRDLAVVGFDNIEAAEFSVPRLSSVNQRFDEVGALAGRLLLAALDGETVTCTPHVPPSAHVELRDSCGCGTEAAGAITQRTAADLRLALLDRLHASLRTGDSAADRRTCAALHDTVTKVDALLGCTDAPTVTQIHEITGALRGLATRPDLVRRITREVLGYLGDVGAPGTRVVDRPSGVGRLEPLTTALWKLQAGALHRQAEITEAALEEQFRVDAALLGAGGSDPCRLGWLAGTHVRAGILALWEESAASGRLHIAGVYDADGVLADVAGLDSSPELFPPAVFVDAAHICEQLACIVVPVSSKGRDWGLLAVIGEVRTTSTLEPYRHWASQLSAYLEQQTLQEAVRANEERYALASQATNDGLWEWNLRNGDVFMSERCCALLGLEPQPEADRMAAWQARVHPDDAEGLRRSLQQVAIGQAHTATAHFRGLGTDGTYRWVLCTAIGVASPGGPVARVVGSLSDIHEQRCLEDQLRQNALHDALTGLPNRRLFLSQLDHAIELWRRSQTPFAVIFLDLDRFKVVNDSLGHAAGDRVLNEIATRISGEVRAVDIGARFGGDEFAILLHDIEGNAILEIARRVQMSLAQPIELRGGQSVTLGASLGIATSASNYTDAEQVLQDADTAMYHSKDSARGSVSLFDPAMRKPRTMGRDGTS